MAKSDQETGDKQQPECFSEWVKHRRLALDLTQEQLAKRANCSVFAIRKIELGDRRPSSQLAGLLAQSLEVPREEQNTFIKAARGELSVDRLASLARSPSREALPPIVPLDIPGNLPRQLTPFIGREAELSTLCRLLSDPQCSLLTIAGPGGIGKTRLAIESANQSKGMFPDGVWFVPLVALTSPAFVVPAIADGINFRFHDLADPQTQLLQHFSGKKLLLILDNAEHLLDGVGLLAEIMQACQQVKLLVTSRERLNLLSEWVFEVQGLPVPASDRAEQFEEFSSVALFLQCARRVRAGFELGEEDRRCVLRICQVMEGMPLGIELAAAWVGMLSCKEIAREIERNVDFLTVSMRDLPERHRSLRATLDHSWNLLNGEEQRILSHLSVFHGSFRLEAAKEICGANLAVLASFRNKMLLYRMEQDLYSLHEIIRQYAERKLREDPAEDERVKDRHSSYYVCCLGDWEKALKSSRQVETFNEMAVAIGNLSQGWQRMITSFKPGTLKSGQFRLDLFKSSLFSLSLFYEMRHRNQEAIALLKETATYLKTVENAFELPKDRLVYYTVLGLVTAYLGLHNVYILQNELAQAYLEEAIVLLEKGQSKIEKAQAQLMIATIYHSYGHLQKTAELLSQSRNVFQEEGDVWWHSLSNILLSSPYISQRKLHESEALLQEALELVAPGDLRLQLPLRMNLAFIYQLKKDYTIAEGILQENLQLSYSLQNHGQTSGILFDLGRLALAGQRLIQAEEYLLKSIDVLEEYSRFIDLSMNRLYLGKCYAAQHNFPAAREQFMQVIQNAYKLNNPQLTYWGLVSIAGIELEEGQTEKALEISLALRQFPIEFVRMKEDGDRLLADLKARLPQQQVEAAMKQVDSRFSHDPSGANALAYAIAFVSV